MATRLDINNSNLDQLQKIGKVLSNPIRIKILRLLGTNSLSISDISEILHIPASTTAIHVKCLEEAGVINTEITSGLHGLKKICKNATGDISISFHNLDTINSDFSTSISMPIGMFVNSQILPTCGMCDENSPLIYDDTPSAFYTPQRYKAQILWSAGGFVEYKFPLEETYIKEIPKKLIFSFEICSEAPNYNEDWPSDLTIWINDIECVNWTCPGDFGSRKGRLNPSWWGSGFTQYGILYTLEVSEEGTYLNQIKKTSMTIKSFNVEKRSQYLSIKIGNKKDAKNMGGFNLFGKKFGDYEQDLVLTLVYHHVSPL